MRESQFENDAEDLEVIKILKEIWNGGRVTFKQMQKLCYRCDVTTDDVGAYDNTVRPWQPEILNP